MRFAARRQFLRLASSLGAYAALNRCGLGRGLAQAAPEPPARTQDPAKTGVPGTAAVPPGLPTLREAGAQRNLLVGTAVAMEPLRTSAAYRQLLRDQASILVAENAMKFGPMQPAPDKFFFDDADALFAFAAEGRQAVRGHNFVWHRQLPGWFAGYATRENAAQILTNHIDVVGARYAGRVHSWDVVNEAIHLSDNLPGGLRNSPWYQLLGPRYLDLAFHTARRVDPKALLIYNEYGIESESADDAQKRAAVLALVRGLQDRGVPIDGVGIQSHLTAGPQHHYGPGLQAFMRDLHGMGLKLLLTEMDVNDRDLPPAQPARDQAVAATYSRYLEAALGSTDVLALLTWGLTDRYTWLNGEDARKDSEPERPLPFDADLRPTLAYVAEVEAVRAAPARPTV